MSSFSEYLKKCIKQHLAAEKCSQNELILACGVNRSTFFQCLRGKRLPTEQLFQTLLERLLISPEERAELERRYRMAQVGDERLARRRSVQRCLRVFSEGTAEGETFASEPEESLLDGAPRTFQGRDLVLRVLDEMVRQELKREFPQVDLFLPPQCKRVFDELASVVRGCDGEQVRLRQVVQFSEEEGRKALESLSLQRLTSRFLPTGCREYEVRYYYADSRYSEMVGVLYPYAVITSDGILLLNDTLEGALLTMNSGVREMTRLQFQENLERTRPFFEAHTGNELEQKLLSRWRGEKLNAFYLSEEPFFADILPNTVFSSLIRKYCDRECWEVYQGYFKNLKRNINLTGFCTEEGIRHFARTGVMFEWLGFAPMELADRLVVLNYLLRAVGRKSALYLVDREQVPVPAGRSFTVFDGKCMLLRSWEGQELRRYQFLEQNLINSYVDFFQGLAKGQGLSDQSPIRERSYLEQVLRDAVAWCETEVEKNAPEG